MSSAVSVGTEERKVTPGRGPAPAFASSNAPKPSSRLGADRFELGAGTKERAVAQRSARAELAQGTKERAVAQRSARAELAQGFKSKLPPNKQDTRGSWFEALVLSTPVVDQVQHIWNLVGGANGAAMTLPSVPKMAEALGTSKAGTLLGKVRLLGVVERIFDTHAFEAVSRFFSRPGMQLMGRVAGRIAPILGAGFALFDIRSAWKTHRDPKASKLRKILKVAKAALSTIAAGAGIATLFLAPTGVGAAIAGAVALVAGLGSMGLDFATSRIAPQ